MFKKIYKAYTVAIENDKDCVVNRCDYIVRREKGEVVTPYYTVDDITYLTFTCNPVKYHKIHSAFKAIEKALLSEDMNMYLSVTNVYGM